MTRNETKPKRRKASRWTNRQLRQANALLRLRVRELEGKLARWGRPTKAAQAARATPSPFLLLAEINHSITTARPADAGTGGANSGDHFDYAKENPTQS